jgi:iron(III) transport system substrate-binding protein
MAPPSRLLLYTAGPDGLAKNIAKSFTDKTAIKVEVWATSGDVCSTRGRKAKPRADVVVLASWGEGLIVRQRRFVEAYGSPEDASSPLVQRRSCRSGRRRACADSERQRSEKNSNQSWFDLATPFWKDSLTMPDPTLSGSAAEFIAIFVQTHGDKPETL